MKIPTPRKLLLGLLACASLAALPTTAQAAASFSLAGDFSYTENTENSTWSFRLDDWLTVPPTFLPLLNDTSRDAAVMWGAAFATPPAMWSEGGGYWGIGKNTTGVEQTGGGAVWAPNEVLLHPKGGNTPPARLVICWRAPSAMVVNVHYIFRKAMACGNGVGYELRTRIGGVDTEVVGFGSGYIGSAGSGVAMDQLGLSFGAGDQMFFRIDTWGDAGCDVTGAVIEITEVAGPPTIVTDPLGGTVAEGCNFTFNVEATGATSYAWYKGDALIPGATKASYSVIDAKTNNAGAYRVVAANASQSVTSAPAALIVTVPAYTTVLFNENFSTYSGNQNANQYQTGLKISHSGTVSGWNRAGGGAIHAVDRTGAGNYAAMIWQDNVLTLANGIDANDLGITYQVDFTAAPATYSEGSQATTETDGMVIEVLRGDASVLGTFTCYPGAYGTASFAPFSFPYEGDGTGLVLLRISPLAPSGHFGGEIDNLRVGTEYVPTTPPVISLDPVGGTVAEGDDFTFSVQASGLPTYQWTKGGNPILGATSPTYSIIDVRTSDAGTYRVILRNASGSVTSAPAILNVTPAPSFSSYQEAVLSANPIHYYPLNETSGTVAADLGTLATTGGTYLGGFTLGQASATTRLGKCVRLDGTPGTLVDLGLFHPGDSVTAEAWANLDPTASHEPQFHIVVGRMDGSYEIDFAPGNIVNFNVFRDGGGFGQAVAASPSARGAWHHLVLVFGGGKVTGYVDGVKASEQDIGGVLQDAGPTPDRVMIGASRSGFVSSFNWKGLIDEVAIYDYALSPALIRSHYRAVEAAPPSIAIQKCEILSWPIFPPGYVLQWATDINGPYQNYTGSIYTEGNTFVAPVPTGPTQKFFQLLAP